MGPSFKQGTQAPISLLPGCQSPDSVDVEPRGGACTLDNKVVHCGAGTKLSMVGVWPASNMADLASTDELNTSIT